MKEDYRIHLQQADMQLTNAEHYSKKPPLKSQKVQLMHAVPYSHVATTNPSRQTLLHLCASSSPDPTGRRHCPSCWARSSAPHSAHPCSSAGTPRPPLGSRPQAGPTQTMQHRICHKSWCHLPLPHHTPLGTRFPAQFTPYVCPTYLLLHRGIQLTSLFWPVPSLGNAD